MLFAKLFAEVLHLLVDIKMPNMNGFELCEKLVAMDINVRVCFMSSGGINRETLRDIWSKSSRFEIRKGNIQQII
jgi:FixJ family two-component response regulator